MTIRGSTVVNPYSPPETLVADIGGTGGTRPAWTNVILVYYAIGLAGTLGSLLVLLLRIRNNAFHPVPEAAEFFGKVGLPWFTMFIARAILLTCAMAQLYRLRKSAAYFATAIVAVMLIKRYWMAQDLLRGGRYPIMLNAVSLAIGICIVVYLWRLVRKGVLR